LGQAATCSKTGCSHTHRTSTDAFIQHFVKDKCEAIMEDVDKVDNIQDGFIHYQLIRFCQATSLQYLNKRPD
jgi:hypothetical protein